MKIAIISGSHRSKSRSRDVANWIAGHAGEHEPLIFDLAEMDFPFWREELWNRDSELSAWWKPYSDQLKACDAVVIVSPEWAGMVPPKLTNFLLFCSQQELAYKPALLVGVSAGSSGTYPIAQLRMNASKNNQMIYLPDHLIVRNAEAFLRPGSEDLKGSSRFGESHLNQRLRFNLKVLTAMAEALRQIRQPDWVSSFPYGM